MVDLTKNPEPSLGELFGASEKEITDLIDTLGAKYGWEPFRQILNELSERVSLITALNRSLLRQEPDEESADYTAAVQKIVTATQDYYAYLGKIPEDVRRFFLLVSNASTGVIDVVSNMMEFDSPLEMGSLISVQSIRPRKYIMQIDAVTNQLAQLGGTTEVRVGTHRHRPVKTTVTLDIPDFIRIDGGGTLSTYDKSIINGVTSLLESGNTVFSVPMLYHAMTGKQNPTVDDRLAEELVGKLDQMRRMILSINLDDETGTRRFYDGGGEEIDVRDVMVEGYLLPLNKVTGTVNGKRTELFQIIQNPPLYTYSKLKKQLASVPISLLDAPVNNNATTIPLKTYLIQRIEMMKNPHNSIKSSRILYDSIYKELAAEDASKAKKLRIRSYTASILEYFIERGYISGYTEFKTGRAIGGIDLKIR